MDRSDFRPGVSNRKPSVIIVENSVGVTGAFKAIFNYAQFVSGEFDFVFVVPKGSKVISVINAEGFKVVELPFVEIGKSLKKLFLYLPYLIYNSIRLLRIAKRNKAYLVHVNDFYNLVGAMGKILGGNYKLLTHIRFMPDRFPALLVKIWYGLGVKYSSLVICVSNAVKKCLPEHPKVKVIYDTIPAIINPPRIEKPQRNDDLVHLLYLGHYIPGKGQDHALEALSLAYQENEHIRLRFVGGDMGMEKNKKYKEKLMARAKELGLEKVVEFYGSSNNIKHEYNWANIALNFSESESFSFTCLEALAHGVPLIVTDSGGPAELFEDGRSGLLVCNKDIKAMADAILYLANDDKVRKSYASEGMHTVSHKFALENTFERLSRIYKQ